VARTYDVVVTIADSALAGKPITASFRSETVDEVLEVIAFAAGAFYERAGRSIVIRRGAVPSAQPGRAIDWGTRIARAHSAR
jgi:ferric-dicitrate binding protein FerR (iron transport regulator)